MTEFLSKFLEAFLPNLVATLIAVGLGIPIGLWFNRRMLASAEPLKAQDEQHHLETALLTLEHSLTANRPRLQKVTEMLDEGPILLDFDLDISTWEAVRTEVVPYLHSPQLSSRLAHHFGRLGSVVKLQELYVSLVVKDLSSALSHVRQVKKIAHDALNRAAKAANSDAAELITELSSRRTSGPAAP